MSAEKPLKIYTLEDLFTDLHAKALNAFDSLSQKYPSRNDKTRILGRTGLALEISHERASATRSLNTTKCLSIVGQDGDITRILSATQGQGTTQRDKGKKPFLVSLIGQAKYGMKFGMRIPVSRQLEEPPSRIQFDRSTHISFGNMPDPLGYQKGSTELDTSTPAGPEFIHPDKLALVKSVAGLLIANIRIAEMANAKDAPSPELTATLDRISQTRL